MQTKGIVCSTNAHTQTTIKRTTHTTRALQKKTHTQHVDNLSPQINANKCK